MFFSFLLILFPFLLTHFQSSTDHANQAAAPLYATNQKVAPHEEAKQLAGLFPLTKQSLTLKQAEQSNSVFNDTKELIALLPGENQKVNIANEAHQLVGGYNYVVNGKSYHVIRNVKNYKVIGTASWYGRPGNPPTLTASGAQFKSNAMDAASKVLPLGTRVKVTDLQNHKSEVVTINDRGPFVHGRIIDLAYGAAQNLGYIHQGTVKVKVQAIS